MTRDTFDMFSPPERRRFGDNESVRGNDSVRSDLVDLPLALHHETARAILVSIDGDEAKAQWLPKSRCQFEQHGSSIRGHSKRGQSVSLPAVTVTLSERLAKEKGLI